MDKKTKTKRSKTETYYLVGELLGKTSVYATGVAVVTFISGMILMAIWDVDDRRQESKKIKEQQNKKQ